MGSQKRKSASHPDAQVQADSPKRRRPTGWRLWLYRLLALTVVPAVVLLLLELGLRLFGFGVPSGFTIRHEIDSFLKPSERHHRHSADDLRNILSILQEKYAWIIIDAPPVMPVSDAIVLSSIVDGVVLVVDSQQPQRKLVRDALGRLDHAHVLGAVLNRADLCSAPYYYRSQYYEDDGDTVYVE